jgi:hypothetical protein
MFEIPQIDGKSGWILMDPIHGPGLWIRAAGEAAEAPGAKDCGASDAVRLEDGDWIKLWDWILMDIYRYLKTLI